MRKVVTSGFGPRPASLFPEISVLRIAGYHLAVNVSCLWEVDTLFLYNDDPNTFIGKTVLLIWNAFSEVWCGVWYMCVCELLGRNFRLPSFISRNRMKSVCILKKRFFSILASYCPGFKTRVTWRIQGVTWKPRRAPRHSERGFLSLDRPACSDVTQLRLKWINGELDLKYEDSSGCLPWWMSLLVTQCWPSGIFCSVFEKEGPLRAQSRATLSLWQVSREALLPGLALGWVCARRQCRCAGGSHTLSLDLRAAWWWGAKGSSMYHFLCFFFF